MNVEKELNQTMEQDPMRGALTIMAHLNQKDMEEKAKEKKHEPRHHKEGFHLTIETDKGSVGLWSCWLENQFFIGYPKDWKVQDEFVACALQLEFAKPVYHEEFVGLTNKKLPSKRLWAKFYGERLREGGRVWVNHRDFDTNSRDFPIIEGKKLQQLYYGHHESMVIATHPYSHFSKQEPDAPSCNPEDIQKYRERFIQLAIDIANQNGEIKAIHIKYGDVVLIPEVLETLQYTDVEYVKGTPGIREGFGGTVVYARKENEEIILKTANSLVPWVTHRKIPVLDGTVTVKDIEEMLTL